MARATNKKRKGIMWGTMISLLVLTIALLVTTVTYAWFRNILEIDGIKGNTGNFQYTFVGFEKDMLEDEYLFKRSTLDTPELLLNQEFEVDSGAITFDASNQTGEFYILVYKHAGSVDLDVSVRLNAQLEKLQAFDNINQTTTVESAEEYIGGFWYSVDKVEGSFGASGINYETAKNKFTQSPSVNDYFPDIRKEVRRATLDSNNYICLRVRFGRKDVANAGDFNNKQIKIYAELCVAQKGGLPEDEGGNRYPVYTEADLKKYLLTALPGDEIIVSADIVHNGDLIINRPLQLSIASGSLTVYGDMRYTFVGQRDEFVLDLTGGTLSILKMTDADAGGNFYVELPNSPLVVYGRALSGSGKADITVENNVVVNAAYLDTGKDDSLVAQTSLGMYLSSVRMVDTENNPKSLYLTNCSKLTVGQHSSIGTVKVLSSSSDYSLYAIRVFILNHGTIEGINLKNMSYFSSAEYENPRILIHNYGIINEVDDSGHHILLPGWSRKYYPEEAGGVDASNTRIIWEDGASEMKVLTDGSSANKFIDDHIERKEKQTLIEKLNADGTSILIHYLDASKLSGWDSEQKTTIANLVEFYQQGARGDKVIDFSTVTDLKIVCYAASDCSLTADDYSYIRTYGSELKSIDLSEAVSLDNELPDQAFYGLTHLSDLTLSEKDTSWGSQLFYNTKIDEITLPYNLEKLKDDSLTVGPNNQFVKFIYVRNKADVMADENYGVTSLFTMLAGCTNRKPEVYLLCGSEAARDILIAKVESVYNEINNKDDDNFFKEKVSGTPVASELMTISTIFVAPNAQRIKDALGNDQYLITLNSAFHNTATFHTYLGKGEDGKTNFNATAEAAENSAHRFDFKVFWIGQEEYAITAYDDFAFFQINASNGSDTFELSQDLKSIGDCAFYGATLPKNVNLGGATYIGHAALAANTAVKNLAGLYVETAGYYACGGFSKAHFMNLPRLTWVYGSTFKGISTSFRRMDIGLVQTAADAIPKTNYADSLTGGNASNFGEKFITIHSELSSLENVTAVVVFSYGGNSQIKTLVSEQYTTLFTNAKYGSVRDLGAYTSGDIKYLTFDGIDVTGRPFEPGDLSYLQIAGTSNYKLLYNVAQGTIDLSAYTVDGIYTLPSYSDENGTTTTMGSGALHYISFTGAHTLKFADSYTTISDSAFCSDANNNQKNKYFAHVDLNNVKTIGKNVFRLWSRLLTVKGPNVTSIGGGAFEQCPNLRTVSFPNVTLGVNANIFLNCPLLKTAVIGPQYETSHAFRGCSSLETVYINMSQADTSKTPKNIFLQGGSADTAANEDLNVIVIGYEYPVAVSQIYNMVTIDADYSSIVFADWVADEPISVQLANSTDSKYTYTYTSSTPTYMFSQDGDDLTIQLSFGLGDITGEIYNIPDTLYKSTETITTILGNKTVKYFTTKVEGTTDANKHVVAIEDNIYNGKIDVDSVRFPVGLKKIGKNAFAGCTLGDVNIVGVESGLLIDDGAFNGAKMSSLTISNATSVGKEAFKGILNKVFVDGGSYIDYPIAVSLGDKLNSIGESAFEGALLTSFTTTHGNDNNTFLEIGQYAFKNVKNGTTGEVAVYLGNAVVTFDSYSFQNVKMSDLYAPGTILVKENAFYMVDISGTVDFSQGVPQDIASAYEPQTIEPYGFRGTSADKNQLGTVKLGRDCLLMGDYRASNGIYPIVSGKQEYMGAFTDCSIGLFRLNDMSATDPQALAFVRCSFEEIRFGSLTTIGINQTGPASINHKDMNDAWTIVDSKGAAIDNRTSTNFVFRNCTDLGNVYFTNITAVGSMSCAPSVSERTKIVLCDFYLVNDLREKAFYLLDITGDIQLLENSTVASSAYLDSVLHGDFVFGADSSVTGYAIVSTNKVTNQAEGTGASAFIYGDVVLGENVYARINKATIYGDIILEEGAGGGNQGFVDFHIYGDVVYKSGSLPAYEGFRDVTIHGNLYLHDGVTINTTWVFNRTNIKDTAYIGQITISGTGNFLFGIGTGTYWSNAYRTINKISFMDSCTEVPSRIASLVYINEIDFNNVKKVGDYAFSNSVIGKVTNMGGIEEYGKYSFGNYRTTADSSTVKQTSINSGLDISGAKKIGSYAFCGLTFPDGQAIELSNVVSIGTNAFENATIQGDLIFGTRILLDDGSYMYNGTVTTISSYGFAGATIKGDIHFLNVNSIGEGAFKGATLSRPLTFGANISLGSSAFYGVSIPAVTFTGSPSIEADAFKGSSIGTLTFEDGGVINAEAFAEGVYGTINLGWVSSIGGSYIPATDVEAEQIAGAFRDATIGTINFQSSCVPTDTNTQPIGDRAFSGASIEFLNFEGAARALVGNSAENSTESTFVAGLYSPFSGANIERLNLNGVTSVGYGYFANMEIDEVDTVTSETIELQSWSLAGTTIKNSSLIFTGDVTMQGFATCGQLKIPNGNLEFNSSLNATGGYNQVDIGGNMIINNLTGTGNSASNMYHAVFEPCNGVTSNIAGNLVVRNSMSCTFQRITTGGLILENVASVPLRGFYKITIRNYVDIECVQSIAGNGFAESNFPKNTLLNLTNLTEFAGATSFHKATNVVTVYAPLLTDVLNDSFSSMPHLESLILPSLTTISGTKPFSGNSKLTYVYVPKLESLGTSTFLNCTSLTAIELPSLKEFKHTWGSNAYSSPFNGCTSLERVIIGDQFENWGPGAFDATNTALQSVILKTPDAPATVTGTLTLPAGAKLTVPYSCKDSYISYFADESNPALWSSVTASNFSTVEFILSADGVNYLARSLYDNKLEIVDIIDTAGVTRNTSFTFPGTLSDGTTTYTVASIASGAMKTLRGSAVTTIVLPSSLEYINFSGIDTGTGIMAYSISDSDIYMTTDDGVLYTADGKTLVLYPAGKTGEIIIPATVEYIGAYAFAGNQGISTITFQGNATIADSAFANCYSLAKIAFESSTATVRFIGRNTVSGCILTGDNKLKIQVVTGSNVVVLYDTDIFQVIEYVASANS